MFLPNQKASSMTRHVQIYVHGFFHHKNPFVGQLYSLEWPRSFTWQKSSIVSFEILYHWCVMPSKWVVWKLNCRIQIEFRKISLLHRRSSCTTLTHILWKEKIDLSYTKLWSSTTLLCGKTGSFSWYFMRQVLSYKFV